MQQIYLYFTMPYIQHLFTLINLKAFSDVKRYSKHNLNDDQDKNNILNYVYSFNKLQTLFRYIQPINITCDFSYYNKIQYNSQAIRVCWRFYSFNMIIGFLSSQALALLFLFFGLTIAVIIKQLQKTWSFIPYTPTLFMVSVALGYYSHHLGAIGDSIAVISKMDPRGILIIFLPPLIFEGAFNSDWYIFRKQSVQIFILAFPSVVISALVIMFSLKIVIGYDQSFFNYPQAFMFGSVLSCTDTVAVLALLKQAGAPKKFNSLIEGQSLLNDGTCMVLLTISLQLVKGGSMQPLQIVLLFIQLTVGAIVLGSIFGMISIILIKLVKKDSILTINITVAMCYILYFVSEYVNLGIRVSGIMALVSIGLYMAAFGKTKFTADAKEKTHEFWKIFVFIAETIIFILGGVLVGTKALRNEQLTGLITWGQVTNLILLYFCMTFARFFAIAVFMPKLQTEGYGLRWRQVGALTYGGLRGAVGIAFTLILASNDAVPVKCRIICLYLMAGCAFLTLLINGPTCGYVIKKLGLCTKSETKVKLFRKFVKECVNDVERKIEQLQHNTHLQKANWQQVKKLSGLQNLNHIVNSTKTNSRGQSLQLQEHSKKESLINPLLGQSMPGDHIDPNLMREIRSRYLIALKGIFWEKFQNNQCSGVSVKNLIQCVDLDLDSTQVPLNSWEYLIGHIHNPAFFPICFWLKNIPLVKYLAFSLIYDRVMVIYDIISTYLQGLTECQQCCTMFPFDRQVIFAIINESKANRKLAQSFLDKQIKIAFPEIMKRIQTAKASHSILTYQKELLEESHRHGQIDEQFYKQLNLELESITEAVQNDSGVKQQLSQIQTIMLNDFFMEMTKQMRETLLREKIDLVFQKDQPIIKNYEKQKYVYLVTRGEINEEWREGSTVLYKSNAKLYQLAGISILWGYGTKQIQYTATAESIVCAFSFPIQIVKDLIVKNPKFQAILYKDMFPLLLKLNKSFKISISSERWCELRPFTTFRKVSKEQQIELIGQYVALVQGQISADQEQFGPGYYDLTAKKIKIKGPARVFYSNSSFEDHQVHNRKTVTIGEMMLNKKQQYRDRVSSQKRNTMGGGGEASGVFNRALFTRDQ